MSMKNLTTNNLRADLATLDRLYAGGIPTEQQDRVNAIKAELKRRGEDVVAPPASTTQTTKKAIVDMNADELQQELRDLSATLSKDPSNDELQTRFADVRYAIRQGAAKPAEAAPPTRSPLPPREMEIPDDVPELTKAAAPASLNELAAKRLNKLARVQWIADAAEEGGVYIQHKGDAVQVVAVLDLDDTYDFYKQLGAALAKAKARS